MQRGKRRITEGKKVKLERTIGVRERLKSVAVVGRWVVRGGERREGGRKR